MPGVITKIEWRGKKVRLEGLGLQKYQMLELGQFGLDTVKARVARGIGANDTRMKPLKRGYAIQKTKAGHGNIRNLSFSGAMIDNLTVRFASAEQVKIALTARLARIKGLANERKDSWLQWSEADQKKIIAKAIELFKVNVTQFEKALKQFRRAA